MNRVNNNGTVGSPAPLRPHQSISERAPEGVSEGRNITVSDESKPSLLNLSVDTHLKIIGCLRLRDIVRLKQVSTYFREVIQEDNALAKAWYRRFPSSHQFLLNTIVTSKNDDQLRCWMERFINDKDLIESLIQRRSSPHLPALLHFTNTERKSKFWRFNLATKATISHDRPVNSASFSADASHMVTAGQDGVARVFGLEADGSWIPKVLSHQSHLRCSARFSANGRRVAVSGYDRTVRIYGQEADGSWERKAVLVHEDAVYSATFSPDGCYLVTSSRSGARIYGLETDGKWKIKASIPDQQGLYSTIISSDGRNVAIISNDQTARIYGLEDDGSWEPKAIIRHNSLVVSTSFSPNGRLVLTVSGDRNAKVHGQDIDGSWQEQATLYHDLSYSSIHFSPFGRFSPDSRHLVTARHNFAKIYSLKDDGWEEKATIPRKSFLSVIFSADSRHVLTASAYKTAKIYGLKADGSWEKKDTIFHDDTIISATFSSDSRYLVTFGGDKAKIYGLKGDGSWQEKVTISHKGRVNSASISTDGRHVVTASKDGTAKICGQMLDGSWFVKATISHAGRVRSATFSADGEYVMTVADNDWDNRASQTVKITKLSMEDDILEDICRLL
ncbi:F-box/WD repeat-containing protein [Endozoicomonas sp. ALD040]|uniref:F-box/WD repeat-containing protein n=1 Tax=Endozoicomonas sp. ALD040 TaxID=3403079 RepID=UPI003BB1A6DC